MKSHSLSRNSERAVSATSGRGAMSASGMRQRRRITVETTRHQKFYRICCEDNKVNDEA